MRKLQFSSKSHYMRWLYLSVIISLLAQVQQLCLAQEMKTQIQAKSAQESEANEGITKLIIKPGQPVIGGMQTEDILVTDDVGLAKEQVAAYPESPEASFILAVALTRTSMVEQALKEVRRARRLADKQGGPAYFDHMIAAYEDMLKSYPAENRVRYGLAWAYYMKAYVLTKYAKIQEPSKSTGTTTMPNTTQTNSLLEAGSESAPASESGLVSMSGSKIPESPYTRAETSTGQSSQPWENKWVAALSTGKGALDNVTPSAAPQIKFYYESALKNLDELLKLNPNDIWAKVYRAFLYAEYTGDLNQSMAVWHQCQEKMPDNPAPYFFLGEGYLKQGNLQECLQNVSKAIALRSAGK
jgi:tetratricopeptide (TPR) repeat protein